MSIIHHVLKLLHSGDAELEDIFWAWINRTSLAETRLPEVAWR
jgi:hypothetical protein